jgi:hypothetical protein
MLTSNGVNKDKRRSARFPDFAGFDSVELVTDNLAGN